MKRSKPRPDDIWAKPPISSHDERIQAALAKRAAREAVAAKILAKPKRKR